MRNVKIINTKPEDIDRIEQNGNNVDLVLKTGETITYENATTDGFVIEFKK